MTDAPTTFSGGGSGPLATLGVGSGSYGLAWPTALPAPSIAGSTATYPAVLGDASLKLQAFTDGYGLSLVFPTRPTSPVVLDLPLSLTGLSASVQGEDQLVLTDDTGAVVAGASPAVMYGAAIDPQSGDPAVSAPVAISVQDGPQGQVLRIAPDMAFFDGADVTYPITVDPSLSVNTDTYVWQGHPGNSYGTDANLKMGLGDATNVARSMIKFDGVDRLAHSTILSAELDVYQNFANSCTPSTVDAYGLTSSFSNSTTWSDQPTIGSLYASASAAHGPQGAPRTGWRSPPAAPPG